MILGNMGHEKRRWSQPLRSLSLVGDHGTHRVVLGSLTFGHLAGLECALLQDDLDDIVLHIRTKFTLESALGGSIVRALHTLVVCSEDLEGRDEMGQRNRSVALYPLLVSLDVVNEDEVVVLGALEVDLGLGSLAASHDV